ncbi:MAG: 50S ribosomal protein L10 [Limnochordales bacterium]|nr:50S ribosomal protein L10 [Limnochordales bacterium]
MNQEEKRRVVAELQEKLAKASGAVLADFRGLTVKESTELRRRLREQGAELRVVKNRLLQRAAQQAGLPSLEQYLEGPTAVALAHGDPAAMAKVLHQFTRDHKNLVLKGGLLGQRVITAEEVVKLAELPPREVLLAKLLGQMQAPLVGLVSVLQGPVRQLVYALDAIRRQREEAGGAATAGS